MSITSDSAFAITGAKDSSVHMVNITTGKVCTLFSSAVFTSHNQTSLKKKSSFVFSNQIDISIYKFHKVLYST